MKKLKPEGMVWVEEQAPAGNWVRRIGMPFTNTGGRSEQIRLAKIDATIATASGHKVRVTEYFYNVIG